MFGLVKKSASHAHISARFPAFLPTLWVRGKYIALFSSVEKLIPTMWDLWASRADLSSFLYFSSGAVSKSKATMVALDM